MLAREQRRHGAVEHVAHGSQQLGFGDVHGAVGANAGGAGVDEAAAVSWRDARQLL
jgi:hypothetical protein